MYRVESGQVLTTSELHSPSLSVEPRFCFSFGTIVSTLSCHDSCVEHYLVSSVMNASYACGILSSTRHRTLHEVDSRNMKKLEQRKGG